MAVSDDQLDLGIGGGQGPKGHKSAVSGNDFPQSGLGATRPLRVPLAERMRPRTLEEVVGHRKILGEQAVLPRLIRKNRFGSLLFYGPPGCGKTTLAQVVAASCGAELVALNAVSANLAELRQTLQSIRYRQNGDVILFIDEIHQFNRSQQDVLLPDLEKGYFRLIGATTKNPGFYLIPPLLSRSHLFKLEPLETEELVAALRNALADEERGLGKLNLTAEPGVLEALAVSSGGDLRKALNGLETLGEALDEGETKLTLDYLQRFGGERNLRYDAREDDHYDIASAFIKSIRGGDPDAAMYWLVRMLEGGEDPRFIARRLVILASEDVGLADARALPVATAAFQACEWIGQPECELNLAHATLFLATAPKSNSATLALMRAREAVKSGETQSVPVWLRDAHTSFNKKMGHGAAYLYSHEFPEGISGQEYMVNPLSLYTPVPQGSEKLIADRLKIWQDLKKKRKKQIGTKGAAQA